MRLQSVLQHSKLALMIVCLLGALVGGQDQQGSLNNKNQGNNIAQSLSVEENSPLIRTLLSRLENIQSTTPTPSTTSEPPVTRVPLLNALFTRLEARQSQTATAQSPQDRLTLTLRDGPYSAVDLDFVPSNYTPEQQKGWNTIVELLADALAFVIEEARKQGYNSFFKYNVAVVDAPSGRGSGFSGPGLSANTLKSLAG